MCTCYRAKGVHPAGIAVFEAGHHSCPGKERLTLEEACRVHLREVQHNSGWSWRVLSARSHLHEAFPYSLTKSGCWPATASCTPPVSYVGAAAE